jgi:predicted  nucleic acid-binding Zn-ribbon protein
MNTTLKTLIRLEQLTQRCEKDDQETNLRQQIDDLRAQLPQSLLRRFDHLAERGRLSVAQVSASGGCGSCHMKLPLADVLRIRSSSRALANCPFCGCFLYVQAAVTEERETAAIAS